MKKPPRGASELLRKQSSGAGLCLNPLPRLIVAASVNRWALRTHRAQISSQLSPVVDAVIVEKAEVRNRWKVKYTHEIDWSGKLLRGQRANPVCRAFEILVVPIDQFGHSFGLVFFIRGFHGELKVCNCIEELDVAVGQMPCQLPRSARMRIGPVLSLG